MLATCSENISLSFQGDFFAMELLDGYIYLHLNLGSGSLKLRGSNRKLDDGAWHKVDVTRNRKAGTLQVDAEHTKVSCLQCS